MPARTPSISTHLANLPRMSINALSIPTRGLPLLGRPLASFEQWAEWCRDPLLALGCRDPVERIDAIKSDDPHRRQIVELFDAWHGHHGERPVKACALSRGRWAFWSIHRDGAASTSLRGCGSSRARAPAASS
jgi:hypothetical protein